MINALIIFGIFPKGSSQKLPAPAIFKQRAIPKRISTAGWVPLNTKIHPCRHFLAAFALLLAPWLPGMGPAAADGASADSPPAAVPMVKPSHMAMSADFNFLLYGDDKMLDVEALNSAAQIAFEAIDALEGRITTWKPGSYASWMNEKAAQGPVEVDSDVFDLMLTSLHYYEETHNVFDVTVGPLLKLWGFYGKQGGLPSDEEIKQSLDKVGFKYVTLDTKARTVAFEKPGMRVDFGGIGKGLALDRAAEILRQQGVKTFCLSAGTSSIIVQGRPPGKDGWTVDIRSPYKDRENDPPVANVVINDEAMSTSSNKERYVEINGKRYGHIFDPRTGMPVDTNIKSASAIAPTGVETEALTKCFFILGVEGAREYCRKNPKARALLVLDHDGAPEVVRVNFPEKP